MKDLLRNIPEIKIELDWDGSYGTYEGEHEIEYKDCMYRFTLSCQAKRELTPATFTYPEEANRLKQEITVSDLKIFKYETLLIPSFWKKDYEQLENQIERNITAL